MAFAAPQDQQEGDWRGLEARRVLDRADVYLLVQPQTITTRIANRSQGSEHDFYSEGDYWWPDPENSEGPYIRRDGESNPDNFNEHRKLLIQFSDSLGALVSAYLVSGDKKYANHALRHLTAWFINPDTRMNPGMEYAQAIYGRASGRSIGLIDTLHMVEVARAAHLLFENYPKALQTQPAVRLWFAEFLNWMRTHPYGKKEQMHPNNHGVCWSLQAISFAALAQEPDVVPWIAKQFRSVYLPQMMNENGGFDAELKRTKPYGYSLFILDAMAVLAFQLEQFGYQALDWQSDNKRSLKLGVSFITPFVRDKTSWPYRQDIQYWDQWPVRHISLLLAAQRYQQDDLMMLWNTLEPAPTTFEVLRNMPIRYPLLWDQEWLSQGLKSPGFSHEQNKK